MSSMIKIDPYYQEPDQRELCEKLLSCSIPNVDSTIVNKTEPTVILSIILFGDNRYHEGNIKRPC